jgi:hypothetical protein
MAPSTKINFFKESECEMNAGHNCLHMKGDITATANQITLTNGRTYELYGKPPHTNYIQTVSAGNFQCVPDGSGSTFGSLMDPKANAQVLTFTADGSTEMQTAPSQFGIWCYLGKVELTKRDEHLWHISYSQGSRVVPYGTTEFPEDIAELTNEYDGNLELVYQVNTAIMTDPPTIILSNEADAIFQDYLEWGSPTDSNYSYICADAADKIIYDHNNTIMNTLDVINFKPDISKMYDSYLEFATKWKGKKVGKKAKEAASAYLGTLYGPRLSASEIADIATREHDNVTHGTTTATRPCKFRRYHLKGEGEARVSFAYRFGVYQSVAQTLASWGISAPTLVDAWDAVPYSFVVDWFVDVSSYLDRSRLRHFMEEIPVSQIWYSEKLAVTGSIQDKSWTCSANLILYYRIERYALGTKLQGYVPPSGSPAWQGKGLQLGSLLVQQL